MLRHKRLVLWLLVLLLCLNLFGCNSQAFRATDLCITVVDVKDGDCILITAPNGHAMMIDTGLPEHRNAVSSALKEAGVKSLDVLVLTHPHNDHIGNAVWVMQNYDVAEVYQIDRPHNSNAYEELQGYLKNSKIKVHNIKAGDTFTLGEVSCRYLAPASVDTPDLNNASAVLRMEYKGKVFLFMGDAQWSAESLLMTTSPSLLDADVLKVGHHALSSTSTAFLKVVTPGIAFISTADPKNSDDPSEHRDTIANIAKYVQELYRTDKDGNILLRYDGKTITMKTEK